MDALPAEGAGAANMDLLPRSGGTGGPRARTPAAEPPGAGLTGRTG